MKSRPLSPHLQVYRPQITSVLSILHRITGAGLFISLMFFLGWIICLSTSQASYKCFMTFMSAWYGQVVIFASLFAFYYHLANGIRHLVWDVGCGYELSTVRLSGWIVVISSIAATILTWSLS